MYVYIYLYFCVCGLCIYVKTHLAVLVSLLDSTLLRWFKSMNKHRETDEAALVRAVRLVTSFQHEACLSGMVALTAMRTTNPNNNPIHHEQLLS